MTNDKITAARAALAEAIDHRTEAQAAVSRATEEHETAKSLLETERGAWRELVDADDKHIANTALSLVAALKRGENVRTPQKWSDLRTDHSAAENRVKVASAACDALSGELEVAQKAAADAESAVVKAAIGVLIAHRDSIAAELNAVVQHYLDLRHKLGGLMSVFAIPGTAETAKALAGVERDYPPSLHPQNFTSKAWAELQKALLIDAQAQYVPIEPSLQPERVDPMLLKQRELRKQQEAERAANAERVAKEAKGYTQAEALAERYGRLVGGASSDHAE